MTCMENGQDKREVRARGVRQVKARESERRHPSTVVYPKTKSLSLLSQCLDTGHKARSIYRPIPMSNESPIFTVILNDGASILMTLCFFASILRDSIAKGRIMKFCCCFLSDVEILSMSSIAKPVPALCASNDSRSQSNHNASSCNPKRPSCIVIMSHFFVKFQSLQIQ